jgi:hypothetical protein
VVDWTVYRGAFPHDAGGLFDHPQVIRRAGDRRKPTGENAVMVGEPYPSRLLRIDAARGAWVHPELSAHYPGWTVLVLAAEGLEPAVKFGFAPVVEVSRALAGVAEENCWRTRRNAMADGQGGGGPDIQGSR